MTRAVLVVGASGLIGTAVVDAFLEAGWDVTAVSRRRPETFGTREFTHLPLDLKDTAACAQALGKLGAITHVVYTAVYEQPGLIPGWSDPEQQETNLLMLRNVLEPLSTASRLEHLTLLQGTKAYGIQPTRVGDAVRLNPMRVPARERHPGWGTPTSTAFQPHQSGGLQLARPVAVDGAVPRSRARAPTVQCEWQSTFRAARESGIASWSATSCASSR